MSRGPVIVVHGGAGSLPCEEDRQQYLQGVAGALAAGCTGLAESAEAAVLAAVSHMEAHTIMNAGRGSVLDEEGQVRLDAGFMEGARRRYGAVTGLRNCLFAARVAARLAEEGDYGRFVAPPGSDRLAASFGLPVCDPAELITERALRLWRERKAAEEAQGAAESGRAPAAAAKRGPYLDTVGAVALDAQGRLAAAVSTGGMSLKRIGRVGDSPIAGAGFWADDRSGACVTTGVGEVLLRQGTARRTVQLLASGLTPAGAAAAALAELSDYPGDDRGDSGLILLGADGQLVLAHSSQEMSGGYQRPGQEPRIGHLWRTR
ncbi:MAG: isoaspartyl peptidase/L-asparaginase [Planctomycetota bacterium]